MDAKMSSVNIFSHLSGLRLSDGSTLGDRVRISSTSSSQQNAQRAFATLPASASSQHNSQHSSPVHSLRQGNNLPLQIIPSQQQAQLCSPYSSTAALSNPTTATTNSITTSTGSIQIFTATTYPNHSLRTGNTNYLASASAALPSGNTKDALVRSVSPNTQRRLEDVAHSSADAANVVFAPSVTHRTKDGSASESNDGTHALTTSSSTTTTKTAEAATLSARSRLHTSSKASPSITSLLPFTSNGLKLSPTRTISVSSNKKRLNFMHSNISSNTDNGNEASSDNNNNSRTLSFTDGGKDGEKGSVIHRSSSSSSDNINKLGLRNEVRTHDSTLTQAAGVAMTSRKMPMSATMGVTLTLASGVDYTVPTAHMVPNTSRSGTTLPTRGAGGDGVVVSSSIEQLNPQILQFFSAAYSRQSTSVPSPIIAVHTKELQSATVLATLPTEERRARGACDTQEEQQRRSERGASTRVNHVTDRIMADQLGANKRYNNNNNGNNSNNIGNSTDDEENHKHAHSYSRDVRLSGKPSVNAAHAPKSASVTEGGGSSSSSSSNSLTQNKGGSNYANSRYRGNNLTPPAPRSAKMSLADFTVKSSFAVGSNNNKTEPIPSPFSIDIKSAYPSATMCNDSKHNSNNMTAQDGQHVHDKRHNDCTGSGGITVEENALTAPATHGVLSSAANLGLSPTLKGCVSASTTKQQHQHHQQSAMTLHEAKQINQFIFDALNVSMIDNVAAKKPIICTLPTIADTGRYIIVGDVHGCVDQLEALVSKIHYVKGKDCLIIIGDFVNKGPDSIGVIRACQRLGALGVLGNHDYTLLKCCQRHHRKPFTQEELRDPVKHLATVLPPDCEFYLRSLPHILRLPAYNVVLVHAGFDFQRPIESQDIFDIMHMRRFARSDEVMAEAKNRLATVGKNAEDTKSSANQTDCGDRCSDCKSNNINTSKSADSTDATNKEQATGPCGRAGKDTGPGVTTDEVKYSVVVKGHVGTPWAELWRGPEHVVFGHDAFSGFQSHPYAYGIDTGCVYGDPLTCVVYSTSSPKGEFYSVPGLSRHTNELLGLPPPNSDVYEKLQDDLDRQIIRPTTRSTPMQAPGGSPFSFLAHPVGYCSPISVGSGGHAAKPAMQANNSNANEIAGAATSRTTCPSGLTCIPVNASLSSKSAAMRSTLCSEAMQIKAATDSVDEVQKATLLALATAHEIHSISILLAMPMYEHSVESMANRDATCQMVQQAFWLPFIRGILEAAHSAANAWLSSNAADILGETSGYLEDTVMFALTICERMNYVRTALQLELKALAACPGNKDITSSSSMHGVCEKNASTGSSQHVRWSRSVQKFLHLLIN